MGRGRTASCSATRGNEEVGTADEEQAGEVGERPNDTLTFELETNESIVIKLFICLFTMKKRGEEEEAEEEQEEEGELERHHEVEKQGRRLRAACVMMISCQEYHSQELLSHLLLQLSLTALHGDESWIWQ